MIFIKYKIMATTRPFAYNTGSTISGTIQIGDIAVGETDQDYSLSPGGVTWWMGPFEDLGYIIALPVPEGDQPTPVEVDAYIEFYRTSEKSDEEFFELVNQLNLTATTFNFDNDYLLKPFLNNNGYWTNWSPSLIAHYNFNDTDSYPGTGTDVYDLKGSSDATISGSSFSYESFTNVNGDTINTLYISGGTGIVLPNTEEVIPSTANTKTYVFWIKLINKSDNPVILSQGFTESAYFDRSGFKFQFYFNGLYRMFKLADSFGSSSVTTSATVVLPVVYEMFTITLGGPEVAGQLKMYQNSTNNLLDFYWTSFSNQKYEVLNTPLYVGYTYNTTGNNINNPLKGNVVEILIYNKKLSPQDISNLFYEKYITYVPSQ